MTPQNFTSSLLLTRSPTSLPYNINRWLSHILYATGVICYILIIIHNFFLIFKYCWAIKFLSFFKCLWISKIFSSTLKKKKKSAQFDLCSLRVDCNWNESNTYCYFKWYLEDLKKKLKHSSTSTYTVNAFLPRLAKGGKKLKYHKTFFSQLIFWLYVNYRKYGKA